MSLPIEQLFAGYSFALSQGIKPTSPLLPRRCVRTRLETANERLTRENLERAHAELEAMRSRQQRQKKNARIARNICALVRHIEMEVCRGELQSLEARREQWRGVSTNREHMLREMGVHVLDLTDGLKMSLGKVETLRAKCDEARVRVAHERELAEEAESRRKVAVCSLRQRCEYEKAILHKEVQELREELCEKDFVITKLNEFCAESVQQIEAQDRQIALHESNAAMNSFSREVSCTLSEMGEVILLRQEDGESVDEKVRDLRDGVKDLVREVKSRRQHSHKMTERVYSLEEERLMWARAE